MKYTYLTILAFFFLGNIYAQFQLITDTSLVGVHYSSVVFADTDNDGDQDMIISGVKSSSQTCTNLYLNNGSGVFLKDSVLPFYPMYNGSIAIADVDNDNDQDVVLIGNYSTTNAGTISFLYINNGSGSFSQINTFHGYGSGADIAIADIDNDYDQDVILAGDGVTLNDTRLYGNNGSGVFSQYSGTVFPAVSFTSLAFADIDNDNDPDLLITGDSPTLGPISKLYKNMGGSFVLVSGIPFIGVADGDIAFADIDNDNDLDVLITGRNTSSQAISKLYKNNGSGVFTLVTSTPFENVEKSSIAFVDFDSDNDQDVLISGYNGSQAITNLYANNGSGVFSLVLGTPFDSVKLCAVAFADIDNDGDKDLVITGINNSSQIITKLYRNDYCIPSFSTDSQTVCNDFTWSNGITYTASNNTATDTLVNAEGCDSIITLNLIILLADISTTISGLSLSSNAINATYQWLDCNNNYSVIQGSTAQSFTATTNGSYAVEVTQNGCIDTSLCIAISSVNIYDNDIKHQVLIYPNPSYGKVNVDLGSLKDVCFKVFDMHGQLIFKKDIINSNSYQFEMDAISSIYFIEISSGQDIQRFKLIVY